MINICPKCGNYNWDKLVSAEKAEVICPKCGQKWHYKSLPLFILTGCSGIGKTTALQELLQRDSAVIPMDADIFTFMGNDYFARHEQLLTFSRNIMQGGKPLIWSMAGALDILGKTYNSRFFPNMYFLALVCSEQTLRKHMTEGRGITDNGWIDASVRHNDYLSSNDAIDGVDYDKFDTTDKTIAETADYIEEWVRKKLYK